MFRKSLSIILATAMALTLCLTACDNKDDKSSPNSSSSGSASTGNGVVGGGSGGGGGGLGGGSDVEAPGDATGYDYSNKIAITGNGQYFAVKADGTLWAWGLNLTSQGEPKAILLGSTNKIQEEPLRIMDGVYAISAGGSGGSGAYGTHVLAIMNDGSLVAWGNNSQGQIGNGRDINSSEGEFVSEPETIIKKNVFAVSAGENISLALENNGDYWYWGRMNNTVPKRGKDNVIAIAAGGRVPCIITQDNKLWWTSDTTPWLENVASVSAGTDHYLAVKTDGTLWAWGSNDEGQIGNGESGYRDNTAPPVQVLDNVAVAKAGHLISYAIKKDGTLWAWGENSDGQLGNGEHGYDLRATTPIHLMDNVAAVAPGWLYSMAVRTDGSLWVWGGAGYDDTINEGKPRKIMDLGGSGIILEDSGFDIPDDDEKDEKVTVVFNFDGGIRTGGGELVQTFPKGGNAEEPTFDPPPGKKFTGWDKSIWMVEEDTTITAQYKPEEYRVDFIPYTERTGGGELTQLVEHGKTAVEPELKERDGYALVAWSELFGPIYADTRIEAIWQEADDPKYTVVFIPDGGKRISGGELVQNGIEDGGSAVAPVVEREGYTFVEWTVPFTNIHASMWTVAIWKNNETGTVTVPVTGGGDDGGNGGSNNGNSTISGDDGGSNDGGSGNAGGGLTLNPDSSTNHNSSERYTVTFDLAGGTHIGGGELGQKVYSGRAATAPITGRSGFIFWGWDKKFDNVTSNMTVTAIWEPVMSKLPNIPGGMGMPGGIRADGPIFDNIILASFHALCAEFVVSEYDMSAGSEIVVSEVASYAPFAVTDLLKWEVIWELYPDGRMPEKEFDTLLRETCFSSLELSKMWIEQVGLISFDNGYAVWNGYNIFAEFGEINTNIVENRNGNQITISVDLTIDGEVTKWKIIGELNSSNAFAPYDLVSVTYVGIG